jgi:hypothetical protein
VGVQVKQRPAGGLALDSQLQRGVSALAVQPDPLNSPRWSEAPRSGFHEAWFVVATDARAGRGLWLRYAVDLDRSGAPSFALWGSWFEDERTFALKNPVAAAAIGRTGVAFGSAELTALSCSGEVEGGGHALRWRLQFGQGAPGEELVPGWLSPVARLRGSGFVLPHPATTVSGAVEVDGSMIELQRVPAAQAHLWGRARYPSWAWARCNSFAEDPGASIDLLDVEGPGGVRVPLFVFRFRGETHRFGELPWIALGSSRPTSPSWHFSAQDARLAIDGVAHVSPSRMVQVQYQEPDGNLRHCVNSELASLELRVRSRAFPGAQWRPEATLTSKSSACLEFCGHAPDPRVKNALTIATAQQKDAGRTGSVAN